MPRIIVTPKVDSTLPVKDVATQNGIDNFRSSLFFYEDFMFLAEARPSAPIQIGSPHRPLNKGPEVDFLSGAKCSFISLCPPERSIGEAVKVAQEKFATGQLASGTDFRSIGERIGEGDVFVSRDMTKQFPERHACLTIEFLEGLVIPPNSIAYEDIMLFKERRSAELIEFWNSIFGIATQIDWMTNSSPELELRKTIAENLSAYSRVSSETWGKRVVDNMSLQFTLDKAAITTLAGAAIGSSPAAGAVIGSASPIVPFSIAILIGALGMVRFSVNLLPSRAPMPQGAQAMSYLSRVNSFEN